MKAHHLTLFALLALSVVAFSQLAPSKGKLPAANPSMPSITPPQWTPYEYTVIEVKDVNPPRSTEPISIGQPPDPRRNPVDYGNQVFQTLCTDMGRSGWQLIQLMPRVDAGKTVSARAVFMRESKSFAMKPGR